MPLHCIYLEDQPNEITIIGSNLKTILANTNAVIRITSDVSEVERLLESKESPEKVFFLDLFHPEEGQSSKKKTEPSQHAVLRLVDKFGKKRKDVLLIGVSNYGTLQRDEFLQRGGDLWLPKDEVKGKVIELKKWLTSQIERRGLPLRDLELDWDRNKMHAVSALAETVGGEGHLKILLGKVVRADVTKCQVLPLQPGLSGAAVLQVYGYNAKGARVENLLVKISMNQATLQREVDRVPKPGEPGGRLYVKYNEEVYEHPPWYAICGDFVDGADTLHDWLGDPKPDAQRDPSKLVSKLFTHGLGKQYTQAQPVDRKALELIQHSAKTRSRVLASLDLLLDLLKERKGISLNGQLIRDFEDTSKPEIAGMPVGTYQCLSHGDLHSRNILVVSSDDLWLIDTGHHRETHWACDPARFCADLWVQVWGGNGAYFWDDLPHWRKQVRAWWRGGKVDFKSTPDTERVLAVLNLVRDNLQTWFGKTCYNPLEFFLYLAMEFLGFSAHPEIPAPRRCLGLVAAHDLLEYVIAQYAQAAAAPSKQ